MTEAWTRKEGKNKSGGLNAHGSANVAQDVAIVQHVMLLHLHLHP